MSASTFYPTPLIESVSIGFNDRTVIDAFESGGSSSRRYWPDKYKKRQFALAHAPMTSLEARRLVSFFNLRGTWDPFWFRDNANRNGNAEVRFAERLQLPRNAAVIEGLKVALAEIAPARLLPEIDEIEGAAALTPVLWFDPNRTAFYYEDGAGVAEATLHDAALQNYPATFGSGALSLGNTLAQWQHYAFNGARHAATASVAEITGSKPALTLFCLAKASATTTAQIAVQLGAGAGAGQSLGIGIDTDGAWKPWNGSAFVATSQTNTADTWTSLAVSLAAGSDSWQLWKNGTASGAATSTRAFAAGACVVGAKPGGSNPYGPSMTNAHLSQVLPFAGQLTTAQIKALHNLFAHQYGMATV